MRPVVDAEYGAFIAAVKARQQQLGTSAKAQSTARPASTPAKSSLNEYELDPPHEKYMRQRLPLSPVASITANIGAAAATTGKGSAVAIVAATASSPIITVAIVVATASSSIIAAAGEAAIVAIASLAAVGVSFTVAAASS
jgi:hypothetical protein